MRLTVVGCSGSFPSPGSASSCYLVEADDDAGRTWRLVLDLGSGALGPLQRYAAPAAVDAVLLSHLHPDHFIDLCGLYVALRYDPSGLAAAAADVREQDGSQVPVYGPVRTFRRLERAYGEHEKGSMALTFDVREWEDGKSVQIGPFTVTPRRVRHVGDAYGVRVEAGGAVLTYSGDTDACDALVELARDADVLLAEASFVEGRDLERGIHLTGLRAGRTAQEAGARHLVLTHLPVWTPPDVVVAEARSAFAGELSLARPGMVVTL
jgi:ribonuclease BN (tRNA processing enzyme)